MLQQEAKNNLGACRDAVIEIKRSEASHAGLLLNRYLRIPVAGEKHPEERAKLLGYACNCMKQVKEIYKLASDRWNKYLPAETISKELVVEGRLIVGLGVDNVLEVGIRLHHTYGVPIIPGSALKGLAAHYCDQVWGAKEQYKEYRKQISYEENGKKKLRSGKHFEILFGSNENAGHLIFHDAWITPDSLDNANKGLVLDVMTPHHCDYYSEKKESNGLFVGPTDLDDPNPITFLSIAGSFCVAVSCGTPGEEGEKWAGLGFDILQEALEHWGVGGKTSSGYGRLSAEKKISKSSDLVPEVAKPKYQPGTKIIVTRTDKTTRKGVILFRADDGFEGFFVNETPPPIEVNESIEVLIANIITIGYQLTLKEPKKNNSKGKSKRQ